MQPKYKFAEGEKVLCFHGPLIYEAKALKSTITKDKQLKYFVHYAGWNKNWDEWVPEHRVLKYNEANLQRQKELQKEHDAKKEKNRKSTPKGKKGETLPNAPKESGAISSGGSESRASTPSKELNTSTSTTIATTATTATTSATATTTTTTTPAGGRANRSKQNATPVAIETKKESTSKEELSKEDKDEPVTKKKRGSSISTNPDKSTTPDIKPTSSAVTTTTPATATAAAITNTTAVTTVACTTAATTTTTSAAGVAVAATTTTTTPSTKDRVDSCVESEETFLAKIEVKIRIPDELKQCLADDWDAITRQHKLLDVPAKITVQDIVDQYIHFKKSAKSSNACKELAISDVLNGVVEYFNVMLGSQLLYKFERQQYAEILQQYPDTPLSKLYGSFHLLRLFVKLGSTLSYSALDEKSMQMLLAHLHDFLKFMVKNSATFFSMSSFVNVTPEYHRHTQ